MKRIRLKRLHIENFKGIRLLEVAFTLVTYLRGPNASGKSTVMDAFLWLLFGMDSHGRTDFSIRTVDENGIMIDNTDIIVEGILVITEDNGQEYTITLKKTQRQVWIKKRGSTAPTFSGNANIYEIDGFPAKQAEFDAKVADICQESLFRLVTDPRRFALLPWKERRKILMGFVSEVTDADVLSMDEDKFLPIRDDVLAAGADKAREKAMSTLKRLHDDQKMYPIRIDEAMRGIQDVGASAEYLAEQKAKTETELKMIASSRAGTTDVTQDMTRINNEMMAIKAEMSAMEREANEALRKKVANAYKQYTSAGHDYDVLKGKIERDGYSISTLEQYIEQNTASLNECREALKEIKARVLPENETICPTCGKPFDTDRIEEITQKFEARRKADYDRIVEKGNRVNTKISEMKAKLAEMKEEQQADKVKALEMLDEVDGLKAAYDALASQNGVDVRSTHKYQELEEKLESLRATFEMLSDGVKADQSIYDVAEEKAQNTLNAVNEQLAIIDANKRLEARVEDLKVQQRECGQRVADQEQAVYLLDEFIRLKMDTLSDRINQHFKKVRFKLFDVAINGSVKETCVMQIDTNGAHVDYSDANTAGQIIGGMDVIDALTELYHVSAPIWIDNSECLDKNNEPVSDSQMILLEVTDDEKLTIGHKYMEGR